VEEDAIRSIVVRLARPHKSGGNVIERAAILAEGGDFADILTWITDHDGLAETAAAPKRGGGLHGSHFGDEARTGAVPQRYVLPAGALD
jgi:hypothetical protein